MVVRVLSQFVLPFGCNFKVWNSFRVFTVQVVAITELVIFFAPLVGLVRKIEFEKLDGLFKLAQVKQRISQNAGQFGLLIGRYRVDQRRGVINHFLVFPLPVINLADVKRDNFLENRVLLKFQEFM